MHSTCANWCEIQLLEGDICAQIMELARLLSYFLSTASLRNVKLKSVVYKYSLLELSQDIGNVGRGGQANHDVQLLQFHIDGVIVLDKEHLDVLFQDLWPEVGRQ